MSHECIHLIAYPFCTTRCMFGHFLQDTKRYIVNCQFHFSSLDEQHITGRQLNWNYCQTRHVDLYATERELNRSNTLSIVHFFFFEQGDKVLWQSFWTNIFNNSFCCKYLLLILSTSGTQLCTNVQINLKDIQVHEHTVLVRFNRLDLSYFEQNKKSKSS